MSKKEFETRVVVGGAISPSLSKALKASQKAVNKASGGIAAATKVVGKATLAMGAAAVAGFVAISKSAIESYAAYEQLAGGVETLFGNSSDQIMKYANIAYKTAGLSANEYMETVTSFSASLLQSLGGDTQKSAQYADMAVIDMADNANKMGTSISSIQQTYQSLAKGNYAMLDNLKLGYGGTKGEMQRLIKEASKLDKTVDSNSMSFGNVVKAIHAVQNQMGITGTTSKEASTTITGSIASMKASWQNLLTGMADNGQDFDGLVNNFVDSLVTVGNNLIPRLTVVFNGVANLISKLAPKLIAKIPEIVTTLLPSVVAGTVSLINAVAGVFPQLIDLVLDNIPALIDAILQIGDSLLNAIPDIIDKIATSLPTLIPKLVNGVVQLIMMLVKVLPKIIQPIIDNLPQIITSIVTSLLNSLPTLIEGAVMLIVGLVQALPQIIQILIQMQPQLLMMVANALVTSLPILLKGVGTILLAIANAVSGVVDTIKNTVISVVSGIWERIKSIFGGVKDFFSGVFNSIKTAAEAPIKWLTDKFEFVKSGIDKVKSIFGWGDKEGDVVKAYANGGTVTRPQLAVVGDAPETIVPHGNTPRNRALLNEAAQKVGYNVGGNNVSVTFAPVINGGNVAEVKQAISESEQEFERKMDRYFSRKGRLSFA